MKRLALLLSLLLAIGLVAGCGDDDDGDEAQKDTTQQTAPPPEQQPEADRPQAPTDGGDDPRAEFLAFQNALADGDDAKVCGSLTPNATEQVEEASVGGSCEDWVKEVSGAYDESSKAKLRSTEVASVEESGDKATIKYTSPILNLPLEAEMERVDGTWKVSKLAENV